MKWLNELKVGDPVVVSNRNNTWVDVVDRLTKTQVITKRNRYKFKKSNSKLVGGAGWDVLGIEEATEKRILEIVEQEKRRELLYQIEDNTIFTELSTEKLEHIVMIIKNDIYYCGNG